MTILELQNVSIERKGERDSSYILNINHLKVETGEHVAITGPSGCGKSTALDIAGMVLCPDKSSQTFRFAPERGVVPIDVMEMWKKGKLDEMAELRLKHMGHVLQTGELLPFLSVRENVMLIPSLGTEQDRKKGTERAKELMALLEIGKLAKAMPATLSIGERQRVAIARALAPSPKLILADEPTAALDPVLARKVMKLFLDAVKGSQTALVLVSHDHDLIREFSFRIAPITLEAKDRCTVATLDDRTAERCAEEDGVEVDL